MTNGELIELLSQYNKFAPVFGWNTMNGATLKIRDVELTCTGIWINVVECEDVDEEDVEILEDEP